MPLFAQRFERAAGGGLLRLLFGAPCAAADLAAVEQHGHGERLVVVRTALGADGISERLSGAALHAGIPLPARFAGTGYDPTLRVQGDFGSNVFLIEEETENEES